MTTYVRRGRYIVPRNVNQCPCDVAKITGNGGSTVYRVGCDLNAALAQPESTSDSHNDGRLVRVGPNLNRAMQE